MKNLLKTAGVVAISAFALQSGVAQENNGTPFRASLKVGAFYDDNIASTPANAPIAVQDSYGFLVRPTVGYLLKQDQLTLDASYSYGMKYYEDRSNSADHTHEFNTQISYDISPKYTVTFEDTFVSAQEAELLDPSSTFTSRSNGNNFRNVAELGAQITLTRLIGLDTSYQNSFFEYEDQGTASRSALLDRNEHLFRMDGRWQQSEKTVFVAGGRFRVRDQRSDDLLAVGGLSADARDSRSYFGYLGVDHAFSSQLTGIARLGAEFVEYPNLVGIGGVNDEVGPFAEGSLIYEYMKDSTVSLGLRHQTIQTDVAGAGAPTTDASATSSFLDWEHAVTARFRTGVKGALQASSFNGGASAGSDELFFSSGVRAEYDVIIDRVTAEFGYYFDRLDSDLGGRSFSRNRVTLGVTAGF